MPDVQSSGWENKKLIRGRVSGASEEGKDLRDSEGIEIAEFVKEFERFGFTFKFCVFGDKMGDGTIS